VGNTDGVTVDVEGRVHAGSIDAVPDPPSLTNLRRRCEAMLPQVDIGELILEVMSWQPRFIEAFTAASSGATRLADLHVTIAAALTGHALNIGHQPVTSPGVKALTRARISHVDQNYLRTENFATANAPLIEAQADIGLAQTWGGGLVAAVDGIRFVVPVRSIDARPNPKYFGRRRGATWLNLLNDQAVGLAGMVVSGTPRDSLNVIDLIYRQEGGRRPEVIVTDTGSYSDIVFGLLRLLGFDYRPQLADLPDAKLWRIDPGADYGPLAAAARGRIDLGRVRQHWPDLVRIVASIHTGAVSAHDVIRMLAANGKPTQLGDALAHYGRVFKTLHVLAYVDDETYRRDIRGSAISKKAATTWPATCSTAARANCTGPTTRAWRTSSAPSAWSSTASRCGTPSTSTPPCAGSEPTATPSVTRTPPASLRTCAATSTSTATTRSTRPTWAAPHGPSGTLTPATTSPPDGGIYSPARHR
jgi:TnpA family transposase